MKILVAVKRVIDPYVKIRVKPDQTGIETNQIKMSMNPFDEIAVEEAVRLKEKGIAKEILAVSIGETACQETLRAALALGADRAIHILSSESLTPLSIAKILKKIAEEEIIDLFILGKQSIDGENNQTGQMLAGLLGIGQGTFISQLEVIENDSTKYIKVVREVDGGLETSMIKLPAVVTTDLRLNIPRYASLPNIMKAKQKPLVSIPCENLELSLKQSINVLKVEPPLAREAGQMLESVTELVDKLKTIISEKNS